jgi:hypothetical protein
MLLASACGPVVSYTQLREGPTTFAATANGGVPVYIDRAPEKPFRAVGRIEALESGAGLAFTPAVLMAEMQKRAVSHGCDALLWNSKDLIMDGLPDDGRAGTLVDMGVKGELRLQGYRATCVTYANR